MRYYIAECYDRTGWYIYYYPTNNHENYLFKNDTIFKSWKERPLLYEKNKYKSFREAKGDLVRVIGKVKQISYSDQWAQEYIFTGKNVHNNSI